MLVSWFFRFFGGDLDRGGDVQVERYRAKADGFEGAVIGIVWCEFEWFVCLWD